MIVVIFRATVKQLDDEYLQQAGKLRQLALDHYGCLEFTALCEGDKEIALSYWPDEDSVIRWKNDPLHKAAQQQGKQNWYQDYQVQVASINREYTSS
ncbi:antibiotic biosynthesis monooxygenase family protein [Alteromonas sp. AMM-1]|uniref:antibiotic biosynthesis monooxygenase family protein n=1 Tax=Alteromonas sp. AMM-1 TaxID=3394233 RepID=UPI0039A65945